MDILTYVFAGALVVLTLILTVVGIQMVLVLIEMRKTIHRVNEALETADQKLHAITHPLQQLAGMSMGVGTGIKVFENFVSWLQRHDRDR